MLIQRGANGDPLEKASRASPAKVDQVVLQLELERLTEEHTAEPPPQTTTTDPGETGVAVTQSACVQHLRPEG
jgi:hypothetical protein